MIYNKSMEKQEIRTFGRRHGKKLSNRKQFLLSTILPAILPTNNKNTGNLILEIGFGNGEHVCLLSKQNPNHTIIGAEPFINGVASLLSNITNESDNCKKPEFQNIYIWPDDVRILLNESKLIFEQIWILHPDPWPKQKQQKRRLLNHTFFNELEKHLSQDGIVIIGTDHWEYYEWITQQLTNSNFIIQNADIPLIQTRYQQKNKANSPNPKYLILNLKR